MLLSLETGSNILLILKAKHDILIIFETRNQRRCFYRF